MRLARRYLIIGRVQGVGFRCFTHAAARREGLDGWVRNLPDGRVEIFAEGEQEALEGFERQIKNGPPGAHIREVNVTDAPPANHDAGFDIR